MGGRELYPKSRRWKGPIATRPARLRLSSLRNAVILARLGTGSDERISTMPASAIFELTGRKALVTGASRGIGKALAQALASAGADVAVTARNEASLADTVASIEALGRRGVALGLDVSDAAACRTGIARAAEHLGGLDVLVNNAGVEEVRPSLDVDEALWD